MKKIVSLILSLAICFSLMPTAFAADAASKFTDVPADAWYRDELNYALEHGYISGTSETTFSPDNNITRGQFVTILGRMLGAPSSGDGSTKFTDVNASSYYAPYVSWAAQNGFVNGTSSTTFAPDNNITFEQMGTILANYINKSGAELAESATFQGYKDASAISGWAASSMDAMRKYDLIPVDAEGSVHPQNAVTRAAGAVALVRLAKGDGLGGKPYGVVQSDVFEKGLYDRFLFGDAKLITVFEPDDVDAIESNIRYMLKNGLSRINIYIDPSKLPSFDAYDEEDYYLDMVRSGQLSIEDFFKYLESRTSSNCYDEAFSRAHYDYMDLGLWIEFGIDQNDGGYMSIGSSYDEELVKRVFAAAIKVHDEMWSSGQITSSMSQKEKARVYYDWVVKNCSYNLKTDGNGWASGVFLNGKASCGGYTAAYNLLLKLEGISCGAEDAPNHIWSTATLDGVFYHIDVTWGDGGSKPNYKYFCMTPEASRARFK